MRKFEKGIHIICWSLLITFVLRQFWSAYQQPVWAMFNVVDIAVFSVSLLGAMPAYRIVKRSMFGGHALFSKKGLASFLNIDERKVETWHLPSFLNGGDVTLDRFIILWSYSFLLYFATSIDGYRQWLVFTDGSIETQKFLIGMCIVGVISFIVSWLFRLPSRT